jgi:cell shape-determining protein MreC
VASELAVVTDARAILRRTVLLGILLELFAASQVQTASGGSLLVSWVRAVVKPIVWSADRIGNLAIDLGLGMSNLQGMIADNRRIRSELEASKARNLLLEEDLRAMRSAGLLTETITEFENDSLVARCSYRDLGAGTMEVRTAIRTLIPRDTPAVTADGLVGRVVRSDGHRHWLQLLTHAAAAVAVQTEDATVYGLAIGTGRGAMEVAYVPRQAGLVRGTVLVTSGADGIYPPGIATAKVVRVRESDAAFLEVGAVPSADIGSVRVVLLLPAWAHGNHGGAQ